MAGVNPDLARERRNATFDVENLTNLLYGGPEKTREEEYDNAVMKTFHLHKKAREMGITEPEDIYYYMEAAQPNQSSPIAVNFGMFIPSIEKLGTKEQKEKWLPKAYRLEMMGTYAQTEMGHGTFIRGLETTATYDPSSQEFVLHMPTITSMKYWPARLGKTTNHCLLMAQLYTGGKKCGIHMFMVQLRDMDTHKLLPGVESGDIGPKFGFGSTDNGFLRLNNVRVPRTNMLMRYAQVHEDGTFVPSKAQRLEYGTMVYVRSHLILSGAFALSQACVIAIRYSAVRRQTEVSPGGEEAQVLDYQTQQYKLFPYLATAYASVFAALYIKNYHHLVTSEIESGNMESMPQLHALCAGLKAYCLWTTADGIEVCRLCCGGHGYLVKAYRSMISGGHQGSFVQYLARDLNEKSLITDKMEADCLLRAYEHRSARLLKTCVEKMQQLVLSGKSQSEAWNSCTVALTCAAKAHCHAFLVKTFIQTVSDGNVDESTRKVMFTLCKLFALHGIVENLGDFIQVLDSYEKYIKPAQKGQQLLEPMSKL